jgi:hypothetical protein
VVSDLQSARIMARAWGESIDDRKRQQAAWAFIKAAVDEYVRELARRSDVAIAGTKTRAGAGRKNPSRRG